MRKTNRPKDDSDTSGYKNHWWEVLCAIPESRDCLAYDRLRRVWFDHTRFHGKVDNADRRHEFMCLHHETNYTVSLWENFSLFDARQWIPVLLQNSGFPAGLDGINKANWSYEWQSQVSGKTRHCDVVVEYEDMQDARHVLLIEAKAPGKSLGQKELTPEYYLGIPDFRRFEDRKALVFIVDAGQEQKTKSQIAGIDAPLGVLTWQKLAGIQISLALNLPASEPIRRFIAGAIQFQFCQHHILPTVLAAEFLHEERTMMEIDDLSKADKQSMKEHDIPFWKLPLLNINELRPSGNRPKT